MGLKGDHSTRSMISSERKAKLSLESIQASEDS